MAVSPTSLGSEPLQAVPFYTNFPLVKSCFFFFFHEHDGTFFFQRKIEYICEGCEAPVTTN